MPRRDRQAALWNNAGVVWLGDKIAELQDEGFCIRKAHLARSPVEKCRGAFWRILLDHLERNRDKPNRGAHRHFLAMPFDPPCFTPEFFFDAGIQDIVRGATDDQVVADQWGCDVPLRGSKHQQPHVDYRRPLFAEAPESAAAPLHAGGQLWPDRHFPGENGETELRPVTLELGDVLMRHPWALHRGTPNVTTRRARF